MAKRAVFRSQFERDIAGQLRNRKVAIEYETLRVQYQRPPSVYKPDWVLPNGIVIETKGLFSATDRTKHLLLKEQHPDLDIRFVFQNPNVKLRKGSKTTYGEWATKHGFQWATRWIPDEWFLEEPKEGALQALEEYKKKKKQTS